MNFGILVSLKKHRNITRKCCHFNPRCGIWDCFRLSTAADNGLPHACSSQALILSPAYSFCDCVTVGILGTSRGAVRGWWVLVGWWLQFVKCVQRGSRRMGVMQLKIRPAPRDFSVISRSGLRTLLRVSFLPLPFFFLFYPALRVGRVENGWRRVEGKRTHNLAEVQLHCLHLLSCFLREARTTCPRWH